MPGKKQPKYDWTTLERTYVQSSDEMTLEAISKLTGSPAFTTVRRYAAEHRWTEKRQEWRDKRDAEALAKVMESSATSLAAMARSYLDMCSDLRVIVSENVKRHSEDPERSKSLTLRQAAELMQVVFSVERGVAGLMRDQDARTALLIDLFMDILEETVADLEKRKHAIRRMAHALETTKL